ncbi:hypothetical protein [Sphingomonas sp. 2378]|uniref:hypothetical protein n=1 Tax=Sphingomonas sp. 2378 TaxID=1219748 RepID=UPI00311B2B62
MTRYQLHLHTRPVAGREEEYHRWYDETHLAEVVGLDGFLTGERFVPVPLDPDARPPETYLAVYEIETDDLPGTLGQLRTAGLRLSDALDTASVRTEVFHSLGAKATRS